MVNLYIDGMKVVMAAGLSVKFVVDNQAFSDQGDYSHEVSLPLAGCQTNAELFGAITRHEHSPKRQRGNYRLDTDAFSSWGDYKVLDVTEETVKIQLMAKKSRANHRTKDDRGNELYIDELPLGDFLDEYDLHGELGAAGDGYFDGPPYLMKDYAGYFSAGGMWRIHDTSPRNNCVLFPVVSSRVPDTELDRANVYKLDESRGFVLDLQHPSPGGLRVFRENLAFQPRITEVARRIFRAIGIDFMHELGELAEGTYLANSRSTPHYAGILPHWTVSEFIRELSNFFNAVALFDDRSVRFIKRSDLFNGPAQPIVDVVDEFTMQCDDESADDYSAAGNVDYDWPVADPILRVPDEVWEQAQVKRFRSSGELFAYANGLPVREKELSRYLFVDDASGETYAHLQDDQTQEFVLSRVDWYPPLLRDAKTRNIQTTLRIIPARLEYRRIGEFLFDYPCLVVDDIIQSDDIYSVNNELKPASASSQNATTAGKRDSLEVFFYDGTTLYGSENYPVPIGVMMTMNNSGLPSLVPYRTENRNLGPLGAYILASIQSDAGTQSIDTDRVYRFDFIHKRPIDIDRPFLIKGKKYICKQLQYHCTPDGVSSLIYGEFYAIR